MLVESVGGFTHQTAPLRIGGVPEHFNTPFFIAKEQKLYPDDQVSFVEVKGGTGAMVAKLRDGSLEVCVALTECLVAEIEKRKDIVLLSNYVTVPLVWGIIVAPGRSISIDELEGKVFGVSRYGSGSHIMAYVLAHQRGWKRAPQFKICNDFETLRAETSKGAIDVFLWETFTTKPYGDRGEVDIIGGIPTPWPCFSIACTRAYAKANAARLVDVIHAVRQGCTLFKANVNGESIERICKEHHLSQRDAEEWFAGVSYATGDSIVMSRCMLESTRKHLVSAKILPQSAVDEATQIDVASYLTCAITEISL